MWDSVIAASVAQAIVEFETAAVPDRTDDSASAIPEHARIQQVHADFLDPRRGLIHIVRSADCKCTECRMGRSAQSPTLTEQIVDW